MVSLFFVASAEDVILSMLECPNSPNRKGKEDVVSVLRSRWSSLDQGYLKKWIAKLQVEAEWSTVWGKAELPAI